jgi:hypothetical protein
MHACCVHAFIYYIYILLCIDICCCISSHDFTLLLLLMHCVVRQVLFVLVNMFIAILSEAYEKAKIEVFGDSFAEQDP